MLHAMLIRSVSLRRLLLIPVFLLAVASLACNASAEEVQRHAAKDMNCPEVRVRAQMLGVADTVYAAEGCSQAVEYSVRGSRIWRR
jgi:hypothetical protein